MHDVILRRYFSGIFLGELLCPVRFSDWAGLEGEQRTANVTISTLLTAREAAKALAVCEKTLWSMTERGEIPVVRIGRSVRYDPQDLADWIAKNKTIGANGAGPSAMT